MSELVERLRAEAREYHQHRADYTEAAARIEALEAALREIRLAPMRFDDGKRDSRYAQGILKGLNSAAEIARAALAPEQDK
jgi:pyruvate formate-lyase activating enzyme-like uncharacterized protein